MNFIIVVLLTMCVGACSSEVNDTSAPPKPKTVPAEAVWSGGPDGGVFLTISKNDNDAPGIYQGRIYNDRTGDLEYAGKMKINDSSRPIGELLDPEIYTGWDGDQLFLADGRYLSALEIPGNENPETR